MVTFYNKTFFPHFNFIFLSTAIAAIRKYTSLAMECTCLLMTREHTSQSSLLVFQVFIDLSSSVFVSSCIFSYTSALHYRVIVCVSLLGLLLFNAIQYTQVTFYIISTIYLSVTIIAYSSLTAHKIINKNLS